MYIYICVQQRVYAYMHAYLYNRKMHIGEIFLENYFKCLVNKGILVPDKWMQYVCGTAHDNS